MKFSNRIIRGFYIIVTGTAMIESDDGCQAHLLNPGDFFGESLIFKTKSVTDFGRIVATSETV